MWSRPKARYAIALNVSTYNDLQKEWHRTLERLEPLCGQKRAVKVTGDDFRRHLRDVEREGHAVEGLH